ncbi:TetR/AcrR family transcriptional regulator [Pseudoalteromonas sp. T1lg22]|uniref:TetR/AcrR family transcriptional regulator n=2 Tax=Pseudoalteromonas TaxID=53246 RepID=UPI000CF73CC1|nr:TetR/AcrR family transcriptional regulator [Pseudoalteromonas sp. T1lg22]
MTNSNAKSTAPRTPQQERGFRRVQMLLDAAAKIIEADGLANLTMQNLAKMAHTSIGSLYHFFSDRDAVLKALFERHEESIGDIVRTLEEVDDQLWLTLSPYELVDKLLLPFANYVWQHGDYLPVVQEVRQPHKNSEFILFMTKIVALRNPDLSPQDSQFLAIMVQNITAGTMQQAFLLEPSSVEATVNELRLVLGSYLAEKERG